MQYQLPTAKCDSSGGTMPRFGPYSDDVGHQTNGVQAWQGQPRYSAIASNETITDQQLQQKQEQKQEQEQE